MDLVYIAISLLFFAVAILYVTGCDRLERGGRSWPSTTLSGSSSRWVCSSTWPTRCWSQRSS